MRNLRYSFARYLARKIEERSQHFIERNDILRGYLEYYAARSPSTGCSYADYALLYNYVKRHKPRRVLECGTGFSTVVLARALQENEEEFGIDWRLVSMEENSNYYEAALASLPLELRQEERLQLTRSDVVEDTYDFFRGVRYKDVPKEEYDFVFMDGPDLMMDPYGAPLTFNYDFLALAQQSEKPISAFIDTRVTTCFVYSLLFPEHFQYDYLRKVGIIKPVTKHDMRRAKQIVSRAMARHEFRRPSFFDLLKGTY